MLNNGGFSGLCKEEDENRRRVACLVEQNDENRCDDDLGSLKRKICDFRCQAYRLTWAVSSCRYARIRSDEALNFLPRASPDEGVSGQASKYLEMVMKSSWRSLGCFWTAGSSTNMKMVVVGGGLGSHQASILQALSFKMINNGFLEV
ncbi:hypothetical protein E3N88_33464 [Mikania micrantha]|uniref:Uncharacterized protein n=1 Tax=Mikania micrantha TaxID=192012 RepID=A0A5N6MC33_9ASTR|nr:hypothetical protein E3N88_33464 [Mikania micrantha]